MVAAKKKTGREVLAELRSKYNAEYDVLGTFDAVDKMQEAYSTGNIGLDYLTGVGGIPKGKITSLEGPFSSGKSTTGFMTMAKEQQRIISSNEEKYLMFFDYERSLDPRYCYNLGLDVRHESFIYVTPDTLEEGAAIFREMLDTGTVSIAVFDSVAAMVSSREREAETGYVEVATRAKMLHQFMRQIKDPCARNNTAVIFLNHELDVVATDPMSQKLAARGIKKKTTPGGMAIPYYASLRISYKKIGEVKSKQFDALTDNTDEAVTGQRVQATTIKNKTAAAFATTELRVRRDKGFSQAWSVLTVLTSHSVIKAGKTGWYEIPERLVPSDLKSKVKDGVYKQRSEETILKLLDASDEFLSLCETEARSLLEQFGLPREDGSRYDSNGELKDGAEDVDLGEFGENLS